MKLKVGKYYIDHGSGIRVYYVEKFDGYNFHVRMIYADKLYSIKDIFKHKNNYMFYIIYNSQTYEDSVELSDKEARKYIEMGCELYQEMVNEEILSKIL